MQKNNYFTFASQTTGPVSFKPGVVDLHYILSSHIDFCLI